MIEICEECGQKYRLDASVRQRHGARFQCRACGHLITIVSHVPLNLEEKPVDVLASDLLAPAPTAEQPRPECECPDPQRASTQMKLKGFISRIQQGLGIPSKRSRRLHP